MSDSSRKYQSKPTKPQKPQMIPTCDGCGKRLSQKDVEIGLCPQCLTGD